MGKTRLSLLIAALLLAGCSSPADNSPPQMRFDGAVPDWAEDSQTMLAQLAQWRQLPFTQDLDVDFVPKEGHLPHGWYDPRQKRLVITTGSETMSQAVLLHEAFHALQDQHFDLGSFHRTGNGSESELALSALIEGEAMLAVTELTGYDFLSHNQVPDRGALDGSWLKNRFLYGDGMKFVMALRDAGGWAAVDAAYADPPRSTALILAPERYLAGERDAVAVAVPMDAGETLADPEPQGAFAVRQLLSRQEDAGALLAELDTAYLGDTLAHVTTSDGRTGHRWVIALAPGSDAERLATALVTAMAAHHEKPHSRLEQDHVVLDWWDDAG